MIPNQWYIVLTSKEVKAGKPVGVTRMGEKMVFWRDSQGKIGCLVDQCPHRGVAFSAGKLMGDCIQCPFHGFEFDTTGRCTLIPANGRSAEVPKVFKATAYPACERHGFIYIWWGEPRDEYPALPEFDFMNDPNLVSADTTDLWNAHYSRVIENQLDVVHVPFVHNNTIGRGNKTVVNGPRHTMEEQDGASALLNIWVKNEIDRGQVPLKASDMPPSERHPQLQFRFPNLWHNWISDSFRLILAFVPIDGEHTKLYLRSYHTVKFPLARQITNFFSNRSNIYIAGQDKRVVITQRPFRSDLRIGEKLIPGDGPVIEYRRKRQALIEGK